ncbi:MAG: DUF1800 domain-containing protein [Acidimicrobiales bacterium]|nr:DUF1800 domain-containing protein [Acidimicrobiales bacterium]
MPLTDEDAAHFCRRVGFGGSPADIAHFSGREIADVVNEVIDTVAALPGEPPDLDSPLQWVTQYKVTEWWLQRMIDGRWAGRDPQVPSPLVEKLALFWHGHFTSGQDKVYDMRAMWTQNQLFRRSATGFFEDLCQEVAVGSAMLAYLDNANNIKGYEQENFARELMELFTCGVGNFTESDVIAMAKAWTGHNTIGWNGSREDHTYVFRSDQHDNGQKTLFGITRNWNGPETITELCKGARQVETSKFITRKLYEFFVHAAPPQQTVDLLAGVFRVHGLAVRELLRAMFGLPEFWGAGARYALVKSPTEWVVDTLRRTGVPVAETGAWWAMPAMGQKLFDPPNVAGWKQNAYWVSTATAWGRARWASHLRWQLDGLPVFQGINDLQPAEIVSMMLSTFGITQPSPATVSSLTAWATDARQRFRWSIRPNAMMVAALCPDFQVA